MFLTVGPWLAEPVRWATTVAAHALMADAASWGHSKGKPIFFCWSLSSCTEDTALSSTDAQVTTHGNLRIETIVLQSFVLAVRPWGAFHVSKPRRTLDSYGASCLLGTWAGLFQAAFCQGAGTETRSQKKSTCFPCLSAFGRCRYEGASLCARLRNCAGLVPSVCHSQPSPLEGQLCGQQRRLGQSWVAHLSLRWRRSDEDGARQWIVGGCRERT